MSEVDAYEFAEFRLEPQTRQLTRNGEPISIRPRHFQLLLLLIENSGRLVSREEIIDRIWADDIVEDGNLTQGIHFLRRLIDDPQRPEGSILTVPKRGYVFTGEVRTPGAVISPRPTDSAILTAPSVPADPAVLTAPPRGALSQSSSAIPTTGRTSTRSLSKAGRRYSLAFGAVLLTLLLGLYIILGSPLRSLTILAHDAIPGLQLDPEFSPDGRFLAFTSNGENGENEDIYLKTVDQGQRIRLTTHPAPDRSPVWSPDGKRIAFLRWTAADRLRARVILADHKRGNEREVGHSRGALGWMPDGNHLIVSDLDGEADRNGTSTVLYLLSLDRLEQRPLTVATAPGTVDTMPRARRDGQSIAFLRQQRDSGREINLLEIATGGITPITRNSGDISYFRWGLREAGFYFVSSRSGVPRLWHIALKGILTRLYGASSEGDLVDQIPYEMDQFTITSEPRLLVYTRQLKQEQVRIVSVASGNGGAGCVLPAARTDEAPQFSPDGASVVYVISRDGGDELWLATVDCRNLRQLGAPKTGRISHPRWAPDGSGIVFTMVVDGQSELFVIDTAEGREERLTRNRAEETEPSWSGDGRWIYARSVLGNLERIVRLPAKGGAMETMVTPGGRMPVESADGTRLYFIREERLYSQQLVQGAAAPPATPLRELPAGWNRQLTRQNLCLLSAKSSAAVVIDCLSLPTGRLERVGELNGLFPANDGGLSLSPDQRHLAIIASQRPFSGMTTVSGWRLKPFSEHMIDILRLDRLLNLSRP